MLDGYQYPYNNVDDHQIDNMDGRRTAGERAFMAASSSSNRNHRAAESTCSSHRAEQRLRLSIPGSPIWARSPSPPAGAGISSSLVEKAASSDVIVKNKKKRRSD